MKLFPTEALVNNSGATGARYDKTVTRMVDGWWEPDFSVSKWKLTERKGKEAGVIYATMVDLYGKSR